ncbi:hypothetical protein [Devosia sp.]|uniref:hypothetical protein n=1 Tax=Devosia sp. TaxID=1871048 RepID=UPI002F259BEA
MEAGRAGRNSLDPKLIDLAHATISKFFGRAAALTNDNRSAGAREIPPSFVGLPAADNNDDVSQGGRFAYPSSR